MKASRWILAIALTMPTTLLAQGTEDPVDQPDMDEPQPMDTQDTQDTQRDRPQEKKPSARAKSQVKMHIVPAMAGIEAADSATSALNSLLGAEELQAQDARKTVQLAKQGIDMAIGRAEDLDRKKVLSIEAKSEADRASSKLRDARATLQKIEKSVGAKDARIPQAKVENLRMHTKDLHTDLQDAEKAVGEVAKAYDISTDLEFGG